MEGDSEPVAGSSAASSPAKGSPVITREGRERMERNRLAAQKRLQTRQQTLNEILEAYEIPNDNGDAPPQKKKRAEDPFFKDLNQVASQGSVVRVLGSKLIDTGGGFLIEEKDLIEEEEKPVKITLKDPAPFIPGDVPKCEECEEEFQHSFLLENYDLTVCDQCKDMEEKHKLITRTDAKQEYLLKDVDFDKREPVLRFITKPNPHNNRWGDMKLYLRLQVSFLHQFIVQFNLYSMIFNCLCNYFFTGRAKGIGGLG